MAMLDANDVKLIGEEMGKVLAHNIMPQLDVIYEELKEMKTEMSGMKAVMVTKEYLDDKLADLEGKLVAQDRKLEKKTDMLIETLAKRRVLRADDVERLETTRVFPQTGA